MTYDAEEFALEQTKAILSEANTSLSRGRWQYYVNTSCWRFLQQTTRQNHNQYELTVVYNNRTSPYRFRDVDEVHVRIDFQDGRYALMLFYEGGFNGCHGHDDNLSLEEVNFQFERFLSAKLPKHVTNCSSSKFAASATVYYVHCTVSEDALNNFLMTSDILPDQLTASYDVLSQSILPFLSGSSEQWQPETIENPRGLHINWTIDRHEFDFYMITSQTDSQGEISTYIKFIDDEEPISPASTEE